MLICIDPGHSIANTGNCAPDKSYYEDAFALDVGYKLKAELQRCGFAVIMTRTTDREPTTGTEAKILAARCRVANDAGADYFISIHTNAAGNSGWYEAQGMSAHIIAKGGQAEKLAAALRGALVPLLGCKDRGTSVDNFAVVRDTAMPAVLVEYGFHTHREEVEKLKTQEYRRLCAQGTARGLCSFLGWNYVPEGDGPDKGGKTVTIAELKAMGYTRIEL